MANKPLTCNAPDRDVPFDSKGRKMKCGYPLPCPWHTAIIDVSEEPAELRIPITAKAALRGRHHLEDITATLIIGD